MLDLLVVSGLVYLVLGELRDALILLFFAPLSEVITNALEIVPGASCSRCGT